MSELNMLPETKTKTQVLVTIFDESTRTASLGTAKNLRDAGINTEVFFDPGGLKKQFKYADKKGIPFVVILGPDEVANKKVTLKNLNTGEQVSLSLEQVISRLKTGDI
jgi:histidyl-tRNA synthetase